MWLIGKDSKVVVEWSTASEFNTAGFNIYRGSSAGQIDQKVNQHIIPASTDPTSGGQYEFVDDTIVPGKQYYYIVEEVDNSGNITRFGPISVLASQSKLNSTYLPIVFFVLGCAGFLGVFLTAVRKSH